MYRRYGKQAHFLVVYIREAHPSDGWRSRGNTGIEVKQPTTFGERIQVANQCSASLKLSIPVAIDGIDDYVEHCYSGWPDRLALVDRGGVLSYYGDRGPRGFRPEEAERALVKAIARARKARPAPKKDDLESALDEALK